jgi:hypothetical protein
MLRIAAQSTRNCFRLRYVRLESFWSVKYALILNSYSTASPPSLPIENVKEGDTMREIAENDGIDDEAEQKAGQERRDQQTNTNPSPIYYGIIGVSEMLKRHQSMLPRALTHRGRVMV